MKNLIFLLPLFLIGCITQEKCLERYPPEIIQKDSSFSEVTTVVKDTTIYEPADTSAWVKALLECDSLGQIRIIELQNQLGKKSKIKTELKNNTFKSTCIVDSSAVYFTWKELHEKSGAIKETTVKVPFPVPAQLTWWEQFKIRYGGYALGAWLAIILAVIIYIVLKVWGKFQLPF